MSALSIEGTWRVYFNRHTAADKPWCVSTPCGSYEIAVAAVRITAPCETIYRPKSTPDDDDGCPSAWIQTTGVLTVLPTGQASIVMRAGAQA